MYKIVVFAQQKWRSVTAKRFWTKIEGRDVPRTEIFLCYCDQKVFWEVVKKICSLFVGSILGVALRL